jgi:hypothetical protein
MQENQPSSALTEPHFPVPVKPPHFFLRYDSMMSSTINVAHHLIMNVSRTVVVAARVAKSYLYNASETFSLSKVSELPEGSGSFTLN